MVLYAIIAVVAIILDQITKSIVVKYLMPIGDFPLFDGVFHLTYSENTGAAFGVFSGNIVILSIFTFVVMVGLIFFSYRAYKKNPAKKLYIISLAMIFGGAVGNFIDRFFNGYVVDFLYFKLIDFAIFNVADMFLCVGAFFMCVCLLFDKQIKM